MLRIVAKCDSFFQMKLVSFGSDQFVQKWLSDIYSSSPGQIYSVFKKDFCIENYLPRLSEHSRIWMTKFRASNLHLPIETGRWNNIPREERICHLCKETIGDEY